MQPPIIPGPNQPYSPASVMPAAAVKPRVHPLSIVLAVVGGVALLCGGVLGIGGLAASPRATASPSPSPVYVTVVAAAPLPTSAAPTISAPPPPPAAPTIREGTWTVGKDFPAGTYRTTSDVGSSCYWSITKSGTNGQDIIANDFPGGGRPTVTLQDGQDFQTSRCGTWALVG